MLNLLEFFVNIISSFPFLLTIESIAFVLKVGLLIIILLNGLRSPKISKSWFFLILVLIGAMFSEVAWIASILCKLFFPTADYRPILCALRLAWAWWIIQYQSLGLFIESLIERNYTISKRQIIFICTSIILASSHIYYALFQFNFFNPRPPFEYTISQISSIYVFVPIAISLFIATRKLRSNNLPKILRKQLKILLKLLIAPQLIADFIEYYPFSFSSTSMANNYAVVSISTILLTMALYFCARKMMGLRFLNFQSHIQSPTTFNFIDDFKDVLEQLSHVTNTKELGHIVQSFFKAAFHIQPGRTLLYIRNLQAQQKHEDDDRLSNSPVVTVVENFISRHDSCTIAPFIRNEKTLVTDEIAFNDFYHEDQTTKEILRFLELINADIFLPIYEKNTIIAYIIVERDARVNEFYSNVERDEMAVFASYLANIINLLQNRNIYSIIQKDKELREELHCKHQEINQYKESIRSFLHDAKQRQIGILFYKNRQFIFGNQAAKELIRLNLNTQEGHPLSKASLRLAQQVSEYKTGQMVFTKDISGNRLILSAIPNLEHNNIIILVYHPEIADIIKEQSSLLQNPTEWDYLLYLETTQSGKLIKQLIPGSGERLLNFKIELLKMALSKKALLLELPEQDIIPIVEMLHHVSLRETLHVLKLQATEKNFETAIKLFGINRIYGASSQEQSLLEKLNNTGTIFIHNIHFLDLETQHYLAEFIRYGHYRVFRGDQKLASNVRIICSSNQNLSALAQENKFSRQLLNELNQTTLSFPSLFLLPKEELHDLAQGFTEQALQAQAYKNLLELNERECNTLINSCPVSFHEFKTKVHQLLIKKSQKNNIYEETLFDPAYNVTDPELVQAARLGKKALKDPKTLALLMNKFKNQNKIATFLGVNRSSVHRRCKEYNITP